MCFLDVVCVTSADLHKKLVATLLSSRVGKASMLEEDDEDECKVSKSDMLAVLTTELEAAARGKYSLLFKYPSSVSYIKGNCVMYSIKIR
jgi:hypothetical protein